MLILGFLSESLFSWGIHIDINVYQSMYLEQKLMPVDNLQNHGFPNLMGG